MEVKNWSRSAGQLSLPDTHEWEGCTVHMTHLHILSRTYMYSNPVELTHTLPK